MEKILKNINRREALKWGLDLTGLTFVGFLVGCDKKNPVLPVVEDPENPNLSKLKLEFTSIPKDSISPYESSNLGIKEKAWLNDKTLNVKAYVAINGAEKIEGGDYKITDDKIDLVYNIPERGYVTMLCTHELNYKFTNLEKKDYKFELIKNYLTN